MKPLAGPAIDAVKTTKAQVCSLKDMKKHISIGLKISVIGAFPASFGGVIVFQHGIVMVRRNYSKAVKLRQVHKVRSEHIYQDPDTLDTWFSLRIWPFSTMGWPDENSEDYKSIILRNTLVTGYDIIPFWVMRMMFSVLSKPERFLLIQFDSRASS